MISESCCRLRVNRRVERKIVVKFECGVTQAVENALDSFARIVRIGPLEVAATIQEELTRRTLGFGTQHALGQLEMKTVEVSVLHSERTARQCLGTVVVDVT